MSKIIYQNTSPNPSTGGELLKHQAGRNKGSNNLSNRTNTKPNKTSKLSNSALPLLEERVASRPGEVRSLHYTKTLICQQPNTSDSPVELKKNTFLLNKIHILYIIQLPADKESPSWFILAYSSLLRRCSSIFTCISPISLLYLSYIELVRPDPVPSQYRLPRR